MEVITTYRSILGMGFDTPELARADEDRLPRIIATHENDLVRMERGELFAGKPPTEEDKQLWRAAIADYKTKWAAVQTQRNT